MDICHGLRLVYYLHVPEPLLRYKQSGGRNVFVCEK